MATLPTPGENCGTWGTDLNEWLLVCHNPDGTIKEECAGGGGGGGDAFAISSGPFTPVEVDDPYTFGDGGSNVFSGTTGSSFTITGNTVSITQPGFYVCTLSAIVRIDPAPSADETFTIELRYGDDLGSTIEPSGGIPWPTSPLWSVTIPAGTDASFEAYLQRTRPFSVTAGMGFPIALVPYLRITNAGDMSFEWITMWGYRIGADLGTDVSN